MSTPFGHGSDQDRLEKRYRNSGIYIVIYPMSFKTRWGGEVCCPKCGSVDIIHRKTRRPQPYRCRDCRQYFSFKTDSLMHSSPLTCRQWVFAIYLFVHSKKGISSVQLGKHLGIQQKSAWHLLHRLRENFVEKWPLVFDGVAEIDETYVGGKFRSMHAKKRKESRLKPNYGKSIVVGMRDRSTGRVTARVVGDVTHDTLSGFIREHARDGTFLYTDDATG